MGLVSKDKEISISRQCELLGLCRSRFYYRAVGIEAEDVLLINLLDAQYTKTPFYGSRKMVIFLKGYGYSVNRKRVQRLMRTIGIAGICPGPNTSKRRQEHTIFPYLLRGLTIVRPNQVWAADITYIRLIHRAARLKPWYHLLPSFAKGYGGYPPVSPGATSAKAPAHSPTAYAVVLCEGG